MHNIFSADHWTLFLYQNSLVYLLSGTNYTTFISSYINEYQIPIPLCYFPKAICETSE